MICAVCSTVQVNSLLPAMESAAQGRRAEVRRYCRMQALREAKSRSGACDAAEREGEGGEEGSLRVSASESSMAGLRNKVRRVEGEGERGEQDQKKRTRLSGRWYQWKTELS